MFLKSLVTLVTTALTVQSLPTIEFNNIDLENPAERAGFHRFEWVTDHVRIGDRLARSSVPYYNSQDSDQILTHESIKFLKQQQITHVISLNHEANAEHIKTALLNNGITYTPLPVMDYTTPTLEDFKRGYKAFTKYRTGTLVWCGYGHGRTGTMISALQLYVEKEKPSPQALTRLDYDRNHVETEGQRQILGELQRILGLEGEKRLGVDNGDGEPPVKKPKVAVTNGEIFGTSTATTWQAFDGLLEVQGPCPAGIVNDAALQAIIDELLSEYKPLAPPPTIALGEAADVAAEEAIWASLETYNVAGSISETEIQQVLNDIIADYPAPEAGTAGASAIGDKDLMALLDTLPVATETELLSANVEVAAGDEVGSVALGDEDIISMMDAAPAVPQGEIVGEGIAEGSLLFEDIIEAILV
ncbi:hypothetical protein MHUMG1_08950 [Metarhizium humberi]|uniref:Swiss Army Knife protein DSP-PTPase phosphatase domain-containing protein n=1 Tax=Metarhizium humberi TaxID=2596975 RepID=A0A9P8M3R1_9HYPO|nr:hypothetical protein MHUMG1_08950 [Metarhizium humberi]